MNSEIFDRLEGLMKSLRLSVENGSYTRAEMKAYSAALGLAAEKTEEVLRERFIDTASSTGLAMFLSMIGKRPAETPEGSRQTVTDSISNEKPVFKKSEFDEALASLGEITYTVNGNEIRLDLGSRFTADEFEAVTRLTLDYAPCFCVINPGNTGRSFEEWENLGLRWFQLDSYNVPFYAADRF